MLHQLTNLKDKPYTVYLGDENMEDYVNNRGIENIFFCTRENVYEDYLEYCKTANTRPMSTNALMFRINKKYNTTTKVVKVCGKCTRVIVPKREA